MKIDVHHTCPEADSYRAARVKSLFNVESGAEFRLQAELPLETRPWSLGIVVGPSGSGKSSIGREVFGPRAMWAPRWPKSEPVIDAIAPAGAFDAVPAALSAVGLGSVPSWLRPFHVLSQGEQFRASLARLVCEAPKRAVVDEFTSVVDRQIAQVGALAFGKAWRRTGGQCVLLSCHYDVLDWLQPDWVFDTATGQFLWGWVRRRPRIELSIEQTDGAWWPLFEPHHYLKLPRMVGASYYVGLVDGRPVAHLAVSTRPGLIEARACRLVVMPEWQGAGVGMRFLNAVCGAWLAGRNRYAKPMRSLFHTSHPGLAAALRRDQAWTQVSGTLVGSNRVRCTDSIQKSAKKLGFSGGGGYGGHFRAVQGFRYLGAPACA